MLRISLQNISLNKSIAPLNSSPHVATIKIFNASVLVCFSVSVSVPFSASVSMFVSVATSPRYAEHLYEIRQQTGCEVELCVHLRPNSPKSVCRNKLSVQNDALGAMTVEAQGYIFLLRWVSL